MNGNRDGNDDLTRLLAAARLGSVESLGGALEASRQYLLLIANQEFPAELRAKAGASDLVQDTLLEGQRDFKRFNGHSRQELNAWLRDILLNNLRDFRKSFERTSKRKLSRERQLDGESGHNLVAGLACAGSSPSSIVVRTEEREAVARAVEELPADQREVIRLRHGDGLPFDEIGNRLGRTTGAAKQLWCRAVRALARRLAKS